ncbi:MAG: L-threonylcarbamoyladenylate synthase [Acutalibacter sp.]
METLLLSDHCPDDIQRAGDILRQGGLVAIPTETVYGLAANALDGEAVKKIYQAKGRPSDNPLIVHISRFSQLAPLVREVPESAQKLAAAFWPGPLTVILPKSDVIPRQTSGGLDTVAVRCPSHPTARAVIDAAGVPLAAPSANLSGKPSPTSSTCGRTSPAGWTLCWTAATATWAWSPRCSPWPPRCPGCCGPAASPFPSCGRCWARWRWTRRCSTRWRPGRRPPPRG